MKYKQTHGGKGSARRNADDKAYADNWDKIFGNKDFMKLLHSKRNLVIPKFQGHTRIKNSDVG